jgi:hypothetical protein
MGRLGIIYWYGLFFSEEEVFEICEFLLGRPEKICLFLEFLHFINYVPDWYGPFFFHSEVFFLRKGFFEIWEFFGAFQKFAYNLVILH